MISVIQKSGFDRKVVYNNIYELSKLFHVYYKNMSVIDRTVKANAVEQIISEIITIVSDSYFYGIDKNEISRKVHHLDFLLRDLVVCGILSHKQKINLGRIINIILKELNNKNSEEIVVENEELIEIV